MTNPTTQVKSAIGSHIEGIVAHPMLGNAPESGLTGTATTVPVDCHCACVPRKIVRQVLVNRIDHGILRVIVNDDFNSLGILSIRSIFYLASVPTLLKLRLSFSLLPPPGWFLTSSSLWCRTSGQKCYAFEGSREWRQLFVLESGSASAANVRRATGGETAGEI